MLLTNRRHRLLHLAVAGMEVGWIAPWALLLIRFWQRRLAVTLLEESGALETVAALDNIRSMPPVAFFLLLFLLMIVYMLAADMLNQRQIDSPLRELIMLGLVVGTSLVVVRTLIYPTVSANDWEWLANVTGSLFNFTAGRRPDLIVVAINVFLWFRVAFNTDRDLTFFGVGLSFRLGLLICVVGGAFLSGIDSPSTWASFVFFALFLVFGLTAVAIARIDEKAYLVESSRGSLLSYARVAQIVVVVLLILGIGVVAALIYSPANIRTFLGWFSPLWDLLTAILVGILYAIAWILAPLIEGLIRFLQRLIANADPQQPQPPSASELITVQIAPEDINALLQQYIYVRYGLVLLMIALILGLIWLFFVRTTRRNYQDEAEEVSPENVTMGGDLLGRGLDRLRNLVDLVRRYGLGSQLLAAISIQNIYANMGRLARGRGYPRPPSQPPDDYLPALADAFPGRSEETERITAAYMRVEYGDRSLDEHELSTLRDDYRRLQETPENDAPEASENRKTDKP